MTKKIFIIAGESSGDFLGSQLLRSLQRDIGDIEIYGIGGKQMEACGLKSLFPMDDLSVMGISEILPSLFTILKRIKQTKETIKNLKPDLLITIDSPGFCFKIAKFAKKIGIPVVHYVAPSVWAWRAGRAKKLAKKIKIDHLLCLLPFEPSYFTVHGLDATFVGHPITEMQLPDDSNFRNKLGIQKESTIICLLPGSRKNEVHQHLQIFLDAANAISNSKTIEVVIPTLPWLIEEIAPFLQNASMPIRIVTSTEEKWQTFKQSTIALAASGTVSLELAYAGTTQVIAYKVSKLTYWIAKLLVKVKYVSLINILNKKMVVPECLQSECNAKILANHMENILQNKAYQIQQQQAYNNAINMLRPANGATTSDVAAKIVIGMM